MRSLLLLLALALPSWGAINLTPSSVSYTFAYHTPGIGYSQSISVGGSGTYTIADVDCGADGFAYLASPTTGSAPATVNIRFYATSLTRAVGSYSCSVQFDTGVTLAVSIEVQRQRGPDPYVVTADHQAISAVCTNAGSPSYVYADVCTGATPASTGLIGQTITDPLTGAVLTQVSPRNCANGYYNTMPISPDGNHIMVYCWNATNSAALGFGIYKMDGTGAAVALSTSDSVLSESNCWWRSNTIIWCLEELGTHVYEYTFNSGAGTLTRTATLYTHGQNMATGGSSKPSTNGMIAAVNLDNSAVLMIDAANGDAYSFLIADLQDPWVTTGCPSSDTNCVDHVDMAPGTDVDGCNYMVMSIPATATGQWLRTFKYCPGDTELSVVSQGYGNAGDGYTVVFQDPHLNAAEPASNTTGQHMGTFQLPNHAQYGSFEIGFNQGNRVAYLGSNAAVPLAAGNAGATVAGGYEGYRMGGQTGDGKSCGYIQTCIFGNTPENNGMTAVQLATCTNVSTTVTCTTDSAHGFVETDSIVIGGTEGMTGLRGTHTLIAGTSGSTLVFTATVSGTYTNNTGAVREDTTYSGQNVQGRGLWWMREDTSQIVFLTKGYSIPMTGDCQMGGYSSNLHFVMNESGDKIAFASNMGYPCENAVYAVDAPVSLTLDTASNEFDDSGHGIYVTPTADGALVSVIVPSGSLSCSFDYSLYTDISSPTNSTGTAAQTWSFTLSGLAANTTYYYRGNCDTFYYGTGSFTTTTNSAGVLKSNPIFNGTLTIK